MGCIRLIKAWQAICVFKTKQNNKVDYETYFIEIVGEQIGKYVHRYCQNIMYVSPSLTGSESIKP